MAQLRAKELAAGPYNVESLVWAVYECPKCPKGAICAPCLPEGIWVSDENGEYANRVFVNAEAAKQFETGQRYRLSIQVSGPERADYWDYARIFGYDTLR